MKIPKYLMRWQFWLQAAITGALVALVWPKIQEGLTAIGAHPLIVWGTVGADLAMMLLWRHPCWQWWALLGCVFADAAVAVACLPVQGPLLALILLFSRVMLVALVMGINEV